MSPLVKNCQKANIFLCTFFTGSFTLTLRFVGQISWLSRYWWAGRNLTFGWDFKLSLGTDHWKSDGEGGGGRFSLQEFFFTSAAYAEIFFRSQVPCTNIFSGRRGVGGGGGYSTVAILVITSLNVIAWNRLQTYIYIYIIFHTVVLLLILTKLYSGGNITKSQTHL